MHSEQRKLFHIIYGGCFFLKKRSIMDSKEDTNDRSEFFENKDNKFITLLKLDNNNPENTVIL